MWSWKTALPNQNSEQSNTHLQKHGMPQIFVRTDSELQKTYKHTETHLQNTPTETQLQKTHHTVKALETQADATAGSVC